MSKTSYNNHMELTLPKAYLSYSQIRLWLDNKEQYRDIYYRGIKSPGSKYLLFGSEISKMLEDGTLNLPALTQYSVQEYQCKFSVDGVPFYGYIDQYEPSLFKFREIKTGSMRPDGRPRWTQKEVDNHLQLDIYSLLIWLKNGKVDDECHLDWIKTRNKMKTITDDFGNTLEAESLELELTGEVESFSRVITQEHRDKARMLIVSIANEISADYKAYLDFNKSISPSASNATSSTLSGI